MMNARRTPAVLCFLVFSTGFLAAEQITKVAVLDYNRILSVFYRDSANMRRLESLKTTFAEETRRLQSEIHDLEANKLAAEEKGDSETALELDERIHSRKQYYQNYIRVKGNQIRDLSENIGKSLSLAQEILQGIEYVAEGNGYSVVLKSSDPDLLWWNSEVDITELVLERLQNQ